MKLSGGGQTMVTQTLFVVTEKKDVINATYTFHKNQKLFFY